MEIHMRLHRVRLQRVNSTSTWLLDIPSFAISSLKADSSKPPSPPESSRSSTVSHASANWSDYSSQSSTTISGLVELLASRHLPKPIAKSATFSPSKGNLLSLAARRGNFSPSLI
ncbi:hypothetical protein AMTR_s00002p00127350 [Amborella trichopoda]|uniref:Uncharacterized protein n=1 Tax=Amborella trichopoda TaxID=13333 RepID=W1NZB6_AMBTC|nr:hypothetical protein AMTR_s00002p00127350 [Amborella trichopoda]